MTVLMSMRQVALELIDCRPNKTGSTVRLYFDDKRIGAITVLELDQTVDDVVASESPFMAN